MIFLNTSTVFVFQMQVWYVSAHFLNFQHFFIYKTPPGPHMKRQKWFHEIFRTYSHCRVRVVNSYADTVSTYSSQQLGWLTPCWRKCWLREHHNNYANTFGKLWMPLTAVKGTIRRKKLFRCVYTPNSNNLKIRKSIYLKKILNVCIVNRQAIFFFFNCFWP